MSYYYSLRGWLEIDPEDQGTVVEKLNDLQDTYSKDQQLAMYMKGWCWAEDPFNWTSYIFYGGDVQIEGINLFERVLNAITGLGVEVYGYFHVQGEDGTKNRVYTITNEVWKVEESTRLTDVQGSTTKP